MQRLCLHIPRRSCTERSRHHTDFLKICAPDLSHTKVSSMDVNVSNSLYKPITTVPTTKQPSIRKLQAQRSMPSKAKVGDWLQQADEHDEESDVSDVESGDEGESSVQDWDTILEKVRGELASSSPKRRMDFVQTQLRISADSPPLDKTPALVGALLAVLPRITDRQTREPVLDVLAALVKRDEGLAEKQDLGNKLVKWLTSEVDKITAPSKSIPVNAILPYHAAANSIMTTLYEARGDALASTPQFTELVRCQALLLDSILLERPQEKSKKSKERGALVRTWRSSRKLGPLLQNVLQCLLKTKDVQAVRSLALLGNVIGVAMRTKVKSNAQGVGAAIVEENKDAILAFYVENILSSKIAVPPHSIAALDDFFARFVTAEELATKVVPVAEKMLLRSPEIALPIITNVFEVYSHDLSQLIPGKLISAILSSSKSTNAETRSKSIRFLEAVIKRCEDQQKLTAITDELLALPKTGKTASPEHRATLYAMVKLVPAGDVSENVVNILSSLFAKEGSDAALLAQAAALAPHLAYTLKGRTPSVAVSLSKEMNSVKTPTRRAVCSAVGRALCSIPASELSESGKQFAIALAPALESNLKSAAANPLANGPGFLEGFVAVAIAFGPLAEIGGSLPLQSNPVLAQILAASPKPSFLLSDKVHARAASPEDDAWILRALQAVVRKRESELTKESIRSAIGLGFIHLAFESKSADVRRDAFAAVAELASASPKLTSRIIRDALKSWYTHNDAVLAARSKKPLEDDEKAPVSKSRDVIKLLSSLATTKDEDVVVDFIVLAHHPELGDLNREAWIGMAQTAGFDPAKIAEERKTDILKIIWDSAGAPPKDERFAEAAYNAIGTLAFVAPSFYVPEFMARLKSDLDAAPLETIGTFERGVWETPAGTPFVDVLNTKKPTVDDKNRKDYATEKWEREVRESQTKKVTLSKADRLLVEAQLQKETEVRNTITDLQARLNRSLHLISSLTRADVDDFKLHLATVVSLLLGSVFGAGAFLADSSSFKVFIDLAGLASPRLGQFRQAIGIAILRSFDAANVPEDASLEPICDLVIRVLHELHFVSEQAPLDATTYTLIAPLLSRVVAVGGIGLTDSTSDEAQEQLTLVVGIIASNCGEFEADAYPRVNTITDLLSVIGAHSRLAKDAASALIDLGAAIKDAAGPNEIQALIRGTLSQESYVRNAALQALQPIDITDLDYSDELWLARHDGDEQNANLASHLWEDNGLDVPEGFLPTLIQFLAHDNAAVRSSCARAFADAVGHFPEQISDAIIELQQLYVDKAKVLAPEYDQFGMLITESLDRQDPYAVRVAVAQALQHLTPHFQKDNVVPLFDFMVTHEALGDRNSDVRRALLDACIAVIDLHGASAVSELIKLFEDYLASPASSETSDYVKEAAIILFGRLARHLDNSDSRIPDVIERLIQALHTPSELVQVAVADCLPPLVQATPDDVEIIVDGLYSTLTTGAKYASRRGAAYGLAGVVKGRGLSTLKEFDLMDRLHEAVEDKAVFQSRQGALFAFETLSATLGRTFEPYIISIIPALLTSFGDANPDVREATLDASRVIMSRISGHCVKLILPTLLSGLEEKQWRTKKGSIELLGAMAFCAPKQLSMSLPTIIPQLTGVINDSHAQVKAAAASSLKKFGEVLSNPEIKQIQSTLLKALGDPTAKTNAALTALLKTSFVHYLDAPSLALVMPILDRGLKQRSSETKRKSVQIVGNMASLTEARDLVPYLVELMPLVHDVLVDPVPEARATAAKALGTLVERLGETNFPQLVATLLQTLRSDTSGVDRQGAAQGLSEVLSGLGMERLEGLLPEIVSNAASPRPYVREGFISLLVYLPATFGHRFAPHLGRIIPPILSGLADDSEYVREASMRAGKMIIANYASKAVDLLLPELERGMLDGQWRIRQSSIALTGELLYRVTGISGKVEMEEEDAPAQGADAARKALLEALGQERRDRVLATLYIVRQDAVGVVRQASIHIWKALVHNTPRTTREILPVLIQMLVSLVGSSQLDQQETASRTLGELCRKNGERILAEIVPILRAGVESPDAKTREGSCLAFTDIMDAATEDLIALHEDSIIAAVRIALVDDSGLVRMAAAKTFDSMQHYIGTKAIDETIPTLLEAMRQPGATSETALMALKEVMSVRANSVFPVLIPTLTAQPITAFNARALGALVQVAGSALSRRIPQVLGSLVKSLEEQKDEEVRTELQSAIEALLRSVEDSEGLHSLQMTLLSWAKDPNPVRRVTACNIFGTFCKVNKEDASDYRVDWIRQLISAFDDRQPDVVTAAWEALDLFVKSIDKSEHEDLVVPMRRSIESTGAPGRTVPGFDRPKGVQSIVPILLAGILSGTQEQREQAAYGIGDVVQRTSEASIKPFIIQLTGPLIRVISGQAIAAQIKNAILSTLTVLLEEVPGLVRPFHPQLTRTFVKSSSDPVSQSVRSRAAAGLGVLMKHQPRVDPLITELIGGVQTAERDIAPSIGAALAAVCSSAGHNIGPAAKASIIELVEETFVAGKNESYNVAIAKVTAGLAKHDAESIRPIVDTFLAAQTPPTPMVSVTILAILEEAPDAFYALQSVEPVVRKVMASVAVDQPATARPAREARELLRVTGKYEHDEEVQALVQ